MGMCNRVKRCIYQAAGNMPRERLKYRNIPGSHMHRGGWEIWKYITLEEKGGPRPELHGKFRECILNRGN